MKQDSVSQRIAIMVEYFAKGNKSAFAKTVGISNQSLGEIVGTRQSAPSFMALQKIVAAFPQVCIEWLVMGRGPMLHEANLTFSNILEEPTASQILEQIKKDNRSREAHLEKQIASVQTQVAAIMKALPDNLKALAKRLEFPNQTEE